MPDGILYFLIIGLTIMSCLFFALLLNIKNRYERRRKRRHRSETIETAIDRKFTDPILLAKTHSTTPNPDFLTPHAGVGAGTGVVNVHFNQVKETIRYSKKKPITAPITKEISRDLDTITESSNEDDGFSIK